MNGGKGNDTYEATQADTIVEVEGGGVDTVQSTRNYTLGLHVENLVLGYGPDAQVGRGNGSANRITGSDENNSLYGFDGNDRLEGLFGNDLLYGGGGGDRLMGGDGWDVLRGGDGDDWLQGVGPGVFNGERDTLYGGAGNDTYVLDPERVPSSYPADVIVLIVEGWNGGRDVVRTTFELSSLPVDVEDIVLLGREVLDATGNWQANRLTGNSTYNTLGGRAGNDVLLGAGATTG